MRNMFGRSLLVIPHTPGTTRRKFRDVAHAAAKVLVRKELRNVLVVLVLDRTLIMPIPRLKTPPTLVVV